MSHVRARDNKLGSITDCLKQLDTASLCVIYKLNMGLSAHYHFCPRPSEQSKTTEKTGKRTVILLQKLYSN